MKEICPRPEKINTSHSLNPQPCRPLRRQVMQEWGEVMTALADNLVEEVPDDWSIELPVRMAQDSVIREASLKPSRHEVLVSTELIR